MLSGTRIKPPELDEFFSAAEAPLRMSEFADLGWMEETVWGSLRTFLIMLGGQPKPDILARQRTVRRRDLYVRDMKGAGLVSIDVLEVPHQTEVRRDDEIVQSLGNRLDSLAVCQGRGKHRVDQIGEAHAFDEHDPRDLVTVNVPKRGNDGRDCVRIFQ